VGAVVFKYEAIADWEMPPAPPVIHATRIKHNNSSTIIYFQLLFLIRSQTHFAIAVVDELMYITIQINYRKL